MIKLDDYKERIPVKVCPHCYAMMANATKQCYECGYLFVRPKGVIIGYVRTKPIDSVDD